MGVILEVKDLRLGFSKKPVLEGVSFNINKGEVFSLVGESGEGKTLLCLSFTKLLPKDAYYSGEVNFYLSDKKINLLNLSGEELRKIRGTKISYIFQESLASLNPFLRIGYQIDEVLIYHKKFSKKPAYLKSLELLKSVGFKNPQRIYLSFPHQISGGEAQRVMIAMALASEPCLLICDEPTSNLDLTVQLQILKLLKAKQEELGFSILFVTHDLSLVEKFSKKLAILHRGRIIEEGETENIFRNPQTEYTRQLLNSVFKL
ncbi:MAG TPA: ABC transporter ATP-binding protein [Candidatus Omnitrophica bacterium]|nr:MAG: ABC transporter ATP-binding protein [Candidatus Omnitrophota bacterium]RKY35358.1 MAG: ABC transporter ATP-binding protein [Candidatus Omnitrophota bacterium]RKY44278.1 MAG: ABC transporter ATP-binding protein [Candidatus Omnitrophota bacterium]HEC68724.1 ABC transporter ATP-binding protein [Candidatus Omnitrophota bacterium]